MLKILKSKKGLTLVELIIGIIVMSVILVAISGVVMPMMRFQARAIEVAEQNAMLDSLANQIIYDLASAIDTPNQSGNSGEDDWALVISTGTGGGTVTYTIDSGIIMREQAGVKSPLLPEGYHRKLEAQVNSVGIVELNEIEVDGIVYELTIELKKDDTLFSRAYAARPLALNQPRPAAPDPDDDG
ncbi:MAG: type II secretion system GspH family protein [Oscillospiraceae bacterium]|nr:type II secretion system GspH family protein [Oscillospiraceae bacterium]